jgi:hypothetical protein
VFLYLKFQSARWLGLAYGANSSDARQNLGDDDNIERAYHGRNRADCCNTFAASFKEF